MAKQSAKKSNDSKKIRICIKAFDYKALDEAAKKIVSIASDSGAEVIGPIPLPTKVEKITVNRSTFVSKDAREQFEIRRHKRLIDILNPSSQTIEMLQSLSIQSGV
ncbi:MAG: 30S ribosomal protein S10 [Candidatus Peribacteria bacterium]|jgi:small subunit ribosomal protein S10|nr:30S ribosomal protein S10 [Candidatus Peribacteria bacterium]